MPSALPFISSDIKRLLTCVSGYKIQNALLLTTSYYFSKWLKIPFTWGLPQDIAIEPTTSCNLRCPECPSGLRSFTRATGMLGVHDFKNWIQQIAKHTLKLNFYFQGEPFLHPDFIKMVGFAKSLNIYVGTSTNAHYIDDKNAEDIVRSGLDRLVVSLDGASQESYQTYRIGGKLSKVFQGLESLQKAKKKLGAQHPFVVLQCLAFQHNEHELDEIQRIGKLYDVDEVSIKTAQIYNFENGSELVPHNEQLRRYTQDKNGQWQIKNSLENQCWKMWQSSVISWDGKILPCCFDKDASHAMGSLKSQQFRDIWRSKPYQEFRKNILNSRKNIDICTNCTEGTQVWSELTA